MNIDLNSILREAADDRTVAEPATGQQLLAHARQQSRRRRTRKIAVGATVLATAGTVAATVVLGAGSLPGLGGADDIEPGTDPELGVYHPIELTFDEALERCRPVLDHLGDESASGWKLHPEWEGPIYVGSMLGLIPAAGRVLPDRSNEAHCEVPYSTAERDPRWVSEPIADSEDTVGLLRQCGAVAGYDLTGWEVVTATSAAKGTEAILRSANDYVATCSLEPDFGKTWSGPPAPVDDPVHVSDGQEVSLPTLSESEVDALPPMPASEAYRVHVTCGDTRQILTANQPADGALCKGSFILTDEEGRRATDAATIEVSVRGGGESFEFPVVNGRYAVRLLDPDALVSDISYEYVVKDESGAVLGRGDGSY